MKRKNLDLSDKLKVIHFMNKPNNVAKVDRICKTKPRKKLQCWNNRDELAKLSTEKIPGTIKRPLKSLFLAIELNVEEFIRYVRSQPLPITSTHSKACALRAAQDRRISNFHASFGWISTSRVEEFETFCQLMKSSTFTARMNLGFPTTLDHIERIFHQKKCGMKLEVQRCRDTKIVSLLYSVWMVMDITQFLWLWLDVLRILLLQNNLNSFNFHLSICHNPTVRWTVFDLKVGLNKGTSWFAKNQLDNGASWWITVVVMN